MILYKHVHMYIQIAVKDLKALWGLALSLGSPERVRSKQQQQHKQKPDEWEVQELPVEADKQEGDGEGEDKGEGAREGKREGTEMDKEEEKEKNSVGRALAAEPLNYVPASELEEHQRNQRASVAVVVALLQVPRGGLGGGDSAGRRGSQSQRRDTHTHNTHTNTYTFVEESGWRTRKIETAMSRQHDDSIIHVIDPRTLQSQTFHKTRSLHDAEGDGGMGIYIHTSRSYMYVFVYELCNYEPFM